MDVCYDSDSAVPPAPGDEGSIADASLTLSTSDGNRYPAYLATPSSQPAGPPIVLLPDAGGLHPFYQELARRFAGLGQPTLAIDSFYPWTGALGREPALPDDFVSAMRRPVLGLFGAADEVVV